MKTLIVAAPRLLDFEKTNESIASKLTSEGKQNFTLLNDNEKFYNEHHKVFQVRILKNPEINKALFAIESISQFFYRSKYQNFLFTSKIDLEKDTFYKSKILAIDKLNKLMPPFIKDENELRMFVSNIGDDNLYEVLVSAILTNYFTTIPRDIDKRFIILCMKEYYRFFYIVKKILIEKDIKSLIIYNGRMIRYAAAYHAGLSLGINNFKFYEKTIKDKNSYYLFSKPIHFLKDLGIELKESSLKKNINFDLGYRYIGKRFAGDETGFLVNFQKNRFSNTYLYEWRKLSKLIKIKNKKLVSIFTSSEYERNPQEEYKRFTGNNILESVKYLFEKNIFSNDYNLVLRAHPHLKGRDLEYQKKIENICKKYNVLFIPAHCPIDSYKLVNASDICISFGSTISAEASLLMKTSISIGKSLFKEFDCVFTPNSLVEFKDFLSNNLSETYFVEKQFNALKYFSTLYDFSNSILNEKFYFLELSFLIKKFFVFFLKKFYTTKNKIVNLTLKIFGKKVIKDKFYY